jgi:hypothetical protein
MNFQKFFTGIVLCLAVTGLQAQTADTAPAKRHNFAVYAGLGPNIYFNNLVLAKDNVNEFNYSFAGRIMWEPEHLLSLGLESGYYRLYSVSFAEQPDVKISNWAVPIQVVISMKFLKHFYAAFSSGQTILVNKVSTPKYGKLDATSLSLGDYAGSVGYKYQLKKRFSIEGEVKLFHASKLDDTNMALLFLAGYSF